MADKSANPNVSKEFDEFLKSAPETADPDKMQVAGLVLRARSGDGFALQTADGATHDIPKAAVHAFEPIEAGTGVKAANLTLSRNALSDELKAALDRLVALPKRPPFDTLKELPADTLKEQPFDTLKEIGHDTIKEQPFDTLKESPFDTLKELPGDGGGPGTGIADTLVEGIPQPGGELVNPAMRTMQVQQSQIAKAAPADYKAVVADKPVFKDIATDPLTDKSPPLDKLPPHDKFPPADKHIKEIVKEVIKEVAWDGPGGGGGTWVENIPNPGDILTNPALRAAQAPQAAQMAHVGQSAQPQLKPLAHDTIKELAIDQTLKEVINDPKHFKEIVKEIAKEVAWEGTGPADTLVEGIGNWGDIVTNPAVQQAGGGVPFVLATPHQASQGAVAQQMLAAQALMGRLGY